MLTSPYLQLWFSAVFLVSLSIIPVAVLSQVVSCDKCKFDGKDPNDCKVYGQIGDNSLIAWALASQPCLDAFSIKDQAVDPATLSAMFPNTDGSNGKVSSFVNYLRFNDGSVEQGIKASFSSFFVESNKFSPPKVVLKDSITVQGQTYDCKSSESSCWTALKSYFTSDGAKDMQEVGKTLYNQQMLSREKEQSLVRIRLCSDGAQKECGSLSDQVQQKKKENPNKVCSAFGLGPGTNKIPGCDGSSAGGSKANSSQASAFPTGIGGLTAFAVIVYMILL